MAVDSFDPTTTAHAVVVDRVEKRRGRATLLAPTTFSAAPGAVVGLAGANGSGKTTLMRVMLGLVHASAGRVVVLGASPPVPQRVAVRIGSAIDTPAFYPWMTGRQVLRTLLELGGCDDYVLADRALERVGLEDVARRRTRTYSQGMRKRLALAAAIVRMPDLLLLDEPTASLDEDGIALVHTLIDEATGRGATVLVASHDHAFLAQRCSSIVDFGERRR